MSDIDDSPPSAVSRELRAKTDRVRDWVLLDGNRFVIAGVVLGLVAVFFVTSEWLGWFPMNRSTPTYYVFSSLISGNLTLITVVVSINQLLLSREISSPGELESQIRNVVDYREDVESVAGEVSPVTPQGFLRLVYEATRQEAQRIGGLAYYVQQGDSEAQEQIDETVSEITRHIDETLAVLDRSGTGVFEVLSVTLTTNYARQINHIRRIRHSHGDDLSRETMDALDDLIETLEKVDVARQYFKSLYLQTELSRLSRVLLYAGIPAEVISVAMLFALTGTQTPAALHARYVMPAGVTVGFLPLALLFSFIFRTATVTQRTAATIPFTTPEQEQ